MNFRLLQWNVMYSENVAAVGEFVKQLDPDVVCLQELTHGYHEPGFDTGAVLGEMLGYHGYFDYGPMVLPDGRQTLMGMGIFSRYALDNERKVVLQPGILSDGKILQDERFYLEADVKLPGGSVRVGTTHLAFHPLFRTTGRKLAMAELIRQRAAEAGPRYVLAGDFNSTPRSKAAQALRQGLRNAGPSLDVKTWTTKRFKIGQYEYDRLAWRLDYVLHGMGLRPKKAEVLQTELSDHLPISAEFFS